MSQIEWLKDIIYILPLAALIWKAASLAAEQKSLRKEVDLLKSQNFAEKSALQQSLDKVIEDINEVKISVVRIETKLEEKEKGDED